MPADNRNCPAPLPDAGAAKGALAANIFHLVLAQGLMNMFLFLTDLAVIRLFGGQAHGRLFLLVSAVGLFMIASDLGLASKAGVRAIARLRATGSEDLGGAVAGLIVVQVAAAGILTVCLLVLAPTIAGLQDGLDAGSLRLAGAWVLLFAASRVGVMLATGFERMSDVLLINPTREIAKLACVVVAWAAGLGITGILVGWVAAHLLTVGIAFVRGRRLLRDFGVALRWREATVGRSLLLAWQGLPYHVPFLGQFGLPLVLVLVVGYWLPEAQVSVMRVCLQLALVTRMVAMPMSNAIFPTVARIDAGGGDHSRTGALLQQTTRLLGLVGTLVLAGYAAFGPAALRVVLGPAYADGTPTLLVLTAAMIMDSYALQLDQVLMAMRHVHWVAAMEAVRYAVFGALSLWLIPRWGNIAAAGAVLAAAATTTAVKMIVAGRLVPRIGLPGFAATLVVAAAVGCAPRLGLGDWPAAPVWLVGVVALRLLRPGEVAGWLKLLVGMVRPRRSESAPGDSPP